MREERVEGKEDSAGEFIFQNLLRNLAFNYKDQDRLIYRAKSNYDDVCPQ